MNHSIVFAQAADDSGLGNILLLVGMAVVFFVFMILPQRKKQKQMKKFIESLASGDKVFTVGGIHGKIVKVKDTTVELEVHQDMVIKVDKASIAGKSA